MQGLPLDEVSGGLNELCLRNPEPYTVVGSFELTTVLGLFGEIRQAMQSWLIGGIDHDTFGMRTFSNLFSLARHA